MEEGNIEQDLSDALISLKVSNSEFRILVEGKEIICDKKLLVSECDYFKALVNFEEDVSNTIEIKGGVDSDSCKIIFDFLSHGTLKVNLSNFQAVLQSCLFLQCSKVEEESVAFISQHLGRENAFNTLNFAKNIGSRKLKNVCKFYIEEVFSPILKHFSPCGKLEFYLAADLSAINQLLDSEFQCGEELLFFSLLGWVENDPERTTYLESLLAKINFHIFSPSCLRCLTDEISEDLLSNENIINYIDEALEYKKLTVGQQVEFWDRRPYLRGTRWPRIIIAASTSNFQGGVQCLDMNKSFPAWKNLTKKPTELRKKSTGSTMLYHHPKLYFMGGEKNWQLHWYNIETNKWGVEPGAPPGRLLSGGAVLDGKLYLVGGVSIEDWDGLRGGTGQVVTSPCVDCYDLQTRHWEQVMEMDSSRSSPGVVVVGGKVWVFGGLKRREMLQSCCVYDPGSDSWEDVPNLPDQFAYFTCLVVDNLVWVMGGMAQDYKCRTKTYVFNTVDRSWTVGPSLNQPRKGAFSFLHNDKIYLCGGSMDGMKYLETIEVLSDKEGQWQIQEKLGLKNWNSGVACVSALLPVRFLTSK